MILTGAPGSGKSTAFDALCTMLEIERVEFGAIESEMFSRGWPWLSLDTWVPQLAAMVARQKEVGRKLFLVVATIENQEELRAVIDALAVPRVIVICLRAPAELVASRIRAREPDSWPGKAELVTHAMRLAKVIPSIPGIDAVVPSVARTGPELALELRQLLDTRGILHA